MSKQNNGGPAFPIPLNQGQSYTGNAPCDGMTLRDYFAAKSMQSLFCAPECTTWTYTQRAEFAYAQADAMLAAREGGAK